MPKLEITPEHQDGEFDCVPACFKMCLDYLRDELEYRIPELSKKSLISILETDQDGGTVWNKVPNLNEKLKGEESEIFIKQQDFNHIDLDDLYIEVDEGFPIIIWYDLAQVVGDTSREKRHAVVVYGYDVDSENFHVFDPLIGEKEFDPGSLYTY